jgi:hypothetical protein
MAPSMRGLLRRSVEVVFRLPVQLRRHHGAHRSWGRETWPLAPRLGLVLTIGTVALTVSACGGSGEPTAASSKRTRSTPASSNTTSAKLFGGKIVVISRNCAEERDLSSHKANAVAAARNLPSLKRRLRNKRRALKRFLAAHPQRTLTPADFAIYRSLRAEYRLAVRRYNGKVRAFNRLADRFNAVLLACKIG